MGNESSFFKRGIGLGRHADAAHVDHMAGGGKEGHEFSPEENRRHHHIVKQMASAEPGVIRHIDIAGLHGGLREVFEEVADGGGHGVHVARRSGHGLGDHVAIGVIDTGGEIACFTGNCAEGGAQQGLGLFFDDGDEAVPHHLGANGFEGFPAHFTLSRMM